MPVNPVAENVFGTLGTVCWTGQLIPQVWKSWREKSTSGLSHWLVLLWGIASAFQGVYVVAQKLNIPLMIQPQLFGFLSLVSWGQCLYYDKKRSKKSAIFITLSIMVLCGVLEFVLVMVIRAVKNENSKRTATNFFGISASVLISLALFPQYWEIYKHKEVVGISLVFISVDMLGGVFNDLSLIFKDKFDVIAAITYSLVVVLDAVVLIAAMILNPLARRRRRREEALEAENRACLPGSRLTTCPTSISTTIVEVEEGRHRLSDKKLPSDQASGLQQFSEKLKIPLSPLMSPRM